MTEALSAGAEVFTPFGATEALPVASIGSREVLGETARGAAEGGGVCVGRPVEGMVVRIIRITDEPIVEWSDDLLAPEGTIGEITVRGPVVTREYHARPEATRLAKIQEGGLVVHRMGDVGRIDQMGRLWMCGRKSHRVETSVGVLFTVPVEEVLNTHPAVHRTALVGVGDRGSSIPVVLIEREDGARLTDSELEHEMAGLAEKHSVTRGLTRFRVYPGPFPVDTRHNAKIEREKLARWAAAERGFAGTGTRGST
jgi:acyl-CoA synthetase (AMP-forming)/AMP-acid ligase II